LYPQVAQITTYTYEQDGTRTSECDVNNRVTYYEYDAFKRLTTIRDEQHNIVKTYCYRFANNSLVNCDGEKIFYNDRQSTWLRRNNCLPGGLGDGIEYVVPFSKHTSTISKADANQKAANDITVNAQNYVNANCQCSYFSVRMQQDFQKQGCGINEVGSTHTYIVPESTITSKISQQDADIIARARLLLEGQNNANQYGRCIPTNLVYARVSVENLDPFTYTGNVVVRFYSDLQGTVAKSVSNLTVNWTKNVSSADWGSTATNYSTTVTGTSKVLEAGARVQYFDGAINDYWYVSYYLAAGNYTIIY